MVAFFLLEPGICFPLSFFSSSSSIFFSPQSFLTSVHLSSPPSHLAAAGQAVRRRCASPSHFPQNQLSNQLKNPSALHCSIDLFILFLPFLPAYIQPPASPLFSSQIHKQICKSFLHLKQIYTTKSAIPKSTTYTHRSDLIPLGFNSLLLLLQRQVLPQQRRHSSSSSWHSTTVDPSLSEHNRRQRFLTATLLLLSSGCSRRAALSSPQRRRFLAFGPAPARPAPELHGSAIPLHRRLHKVPTISAPSPSFPLRRRDSDHPSTLAPSSPPAPVSHHPSSSRPKVLLHLGSSSPTAIFLLPAASRAHDPPSLPQQSTATTRGPLQQATHHQQQIEQRILSPSPIYCFPGMHCRDS